MINADDMFRAFEPHREDAVVIVTGTAGKHWADHTTKQNRDLNMGGNWMVDQQAALLRPETLIEEFKKIGVTHIVTIPDLFVDAGAMILVIPVGLMVLYFAQRKRGDYDAAVD